MRKLLFTLLFTALFVLSTTVSNAQEQNLQSVTLTEENADEMFERLEEAGFSGLIYLKLAENKVFERPFGMANKALRIENGSSTIFAIGSRPIDFTRASILLLDQRGDISLNDPISDYLDDIPDDKQSIQIIHLMSGRSGLPNFFDNASDWNPDLAWVSRDEAFARMMNQELLFEPGTDRQHSHGAFGLLAILIEHVSDMDYYEFLKVNFFDPAGMTMTNEYGVADSLSLSDFAEGGGPEFIGIPNIPPNWGPTSWLVKGSGGMYSTLGDLQRFYEAVRSTDILDSNHNYAFNSPTVNLDGSMRGFELFSAYNPEGGEAYLFLNNLADREIAEHFTREIEGLIFAPGF